MKQGTKIDTPISKDSFQKGSKQQSASKQKKKLKVCISGYDQLMKQKMSCTTILLPYNLPYPSHD